MQVKCVSYYALYYVHFGMYYEDVLYDIYCNLGRNRRFISGIKDVLVEIYFYPFVIKGVWNVPKTSTLLIKETSEKDTEKQGCTEILQFKVLKKHFVR